MHRIADAVQQQQLLVHRDEGSDEEKKETDVVPQPADQDAPPLQGIDEAPTVAPIDGRYQIENRLAASRRH